MDTESRRSRRAGSGMTWIVTRGWPLLVAAVLSLVMSVVVAPAAHAAVPTVTSVSPTSGPLAGGTAVTINGSNFIKGGVNTVTFGGVAATSVTAASTSKITATTPAGVSASAVNVVVTNTNGTGTLSSGYTYYSLTPFSCTSNLFQISSSGGGGLYKYLSPSNSMQRVGTGGISGINGMGYNTADNFMYAFASSGNLVQIDANGVFVDKGAVTPAVSSTTAAAFVSPNHILVGSSSSWKNVTVNTSPPTSTAVTFTGASWGAADIAVYDDGGGQDGYGLNGTTLSIVNLSTNVVVNKTVIGSTSGSYGAAYADSAGNLYFYNNTDGKVFLLTQTEVAKASPTAQYLGGTPVYATGTTTTLSAPNDGAYCPTAPAPYVPPTVTTVAASGVASTTATLNGTVTPNGAQTTATFTYGTSSDLSSGTTTVTAVGSPVVGSSGATSVSYALTGLTSGTTYYFRATGNNGFGGNVNGSILSFTPTAPTSPTVSTTTVGTVASTTAALSGTVTPNGSATTVWFDYSTDPTMTTGVTSVAGTPPSVVATGSPTAVATTLTGLTAGTRYYARIRAVNTTGTTNGSIANFLSLGVPAVTTGAATSVGTTTATLNGSITPFGSSTTAQFQYGTTADLSGTTTTVTATGSPVAPNAANDPTAVSYALTGLTQGTTYYYRAIGTNSTGTTRGSIVSFVYVSTTPIVTTSAATSVGSTTATLNGSVNANGFSSVVTFTYGTSPTLASGNTTVTATPSPVTGSSATPVSAALSGLAVGTTYYFRVTGNSSQGITDGAILSFTPTSAPAVTTLPTSAIGSTTATLNATITSNGLSTIATFRYGQDPLFVVGTTVTAAQSPVTAAGPTAVTAAVTGLTSGLQYYVRATGVNSLGTTNGSSVSFTTNSVPVATSVAASSVGTTTATLNGTVSPGGLSTAVTFTYGPTSDLVADSIVVTGDQSPLAASAGTTPITFTLTGLASGTTYYFQATGMNSLGQSDGTILSFTTAPVLSPPVNTVAPAVTGSTVVGSTLTTTHGTWTGSPTPTLSYLWQSCTTSDCSGGTVSDIATGTGTYVLTGSELGKYVRAKVTGTNGSGTVVAYSNITSVVVGPQPTVTTVSPSQGPAGGATSVVITGTDFTGATAVTFGGTAAASYVVNSATQITATTPAGSAGPVTVAVTTSGGTGTKALGFTYINTPDAPTLGLITTSNGSVTVPFTPGADNGSAITNYQYSIDGGSSWVTRSPASATSPLVITGLTNGTTYSVALRAVNANGSGAASANSAATPHAIAPAAPTLVSLTPGDHSLSAEFTAGDSGGSAITNYEYSTDGGSHWQPVAPAATTSPIVITTLSTNGITPLANGTSYNVKLRAVTLLLTGAASNQLSGIPSTTPSVPTGVVITAGNGSLSVAFTAASDGGSAITNYEYSTDGGGSWIVPSPAVLASPLVISGLTNGNHYNVQIRARNDNGASSATATVVGTPAAVLASAPTALSYTPGDQTLTVAFTPGSDGGATITTYEYSTDGGTTWRTRTVGGATSPIVITTTSTDNTALVNGHEYSVQLRAYTAAGSGVASDTLPATPTTTPAAPTGVVITPGNGSLSVAFTPGADGGLPILNYQFSVNGGVSWVTSSPTVTSSPIVITGLANGTAYSIQLRAVNADGAGAASTATPGTPAAVKASAPTLVSAAHGDQSLSVSFTAGSNGGATITTYEYSTDGGEHWRTRATGTTGSPVTITTLSTDGVTRLTNGTSYPIQLRAVTSVGSGFASASLAATPSTTPGAPTITAVASGNQSLSVTFSGAAANGSTITNYQYSVNSGASWVTPNPAITSSPMVITGLTNGNSYGVVLRAVNGDGAGASSNTWTEHAGAVAPAAPTALSYTPGDLSLSVAFTPGSNGGSAISSYEYSTDGGTSWRARATGTTASPIVITAQSLDGAPLQNGTSYNVQLRAINGAGTGAASVTLPAIPSTTPAAPTALVITRGDSSLSVAFTAGSDGGSAITNYEYSVNDGASWVAFSPADTTSPVVINGLTNGNSYNVQLRAINANGEGAASATSTATPATTASAPTLVSLTPGNGSLSAAFTAGSNGGTAITTYEYSTDGGSTWRERATGTTASPVVITTLSTNGTTPLANGTTYNVKLRAVTSVPTGAASNQLSAAPSTTPAAPTIGTITEGNGSLSVAFTAGANGGLPITNYRYSTDGGTTWTTRSPAATSAPLLITGLTNGTTYTVKLLAVNANGEGAASDGASATPHAVAASAPTLVSLSPGDGSLSAAFTAPVSNGGTTITSYEYSTDGGTNWLIRGSGGTTSPIVITLASSSGNPPLVNGTSYDVKVRAVTTVPGGAASNQLTGVPATTPATPTIGAIEPGNGSLSVPFTAGADNGSAITNYEYSIDGGTSWVTRSPAETGSPVLISGLTNGHSYDVQVRAVNARGSGAASSTVAATPAGAAPTAPTLNSVIAGDKSLSADFTAGSAGADPITTYWYSTDNGATWANRSTGTTESPILITALSTNGTTPLENGTTYNVLVRAKSNSGAGTPSNMIAATPTATASAPTITSIAPGDDSLTVNFNAPANTGGLPITNYEYSTDNGTLWVTPAPAVTGSPLVIDGLEDNITYRVKVRAVNSRGPGAESNMMEGTPVPMPPDPPTITSVQHADKTLTIRFTPGDDGGSAIENYAYSTDAGVTWTTPDPHVTASPLTITKASCLAPAVCPDLVNGTEYQVQLKAINIDGESVASNEVNATPSTTPAAPTSLVVTTGDSTLSVAFTAGSNGGSAITAYQYSLNGGVTWVTPSPAVTSSPLVITGLTNGTPYSVQLRARNVDGVGDSSTSASGTPSTVPSAPSLAVNSITPGDDVLSVAFTAGSTGGSAIISYQYSTDNGSSWVTPAVAVTASPLVIGGLEDGHTYQVRLRGVNANGPGAQSNMREGTPVAVPPSPPTLDAITTGDRSLSVAFTPGDDGGTTITSYQYSLNGAAWTTASGTVSPIAIGSLTNGTSYTVRLRAINADGASLESNSLSGTPSTVPGAPTLNVIVAGDDILTAPFSAPLDNGGATITNYEYSVDNGSSWVTPNPAVTTSPMVIPGLTDHVTYQVKLRALNSNGPGAASNMRTGTPISVPPAAPTVASPLTNGNRTLGVAFTPGDTGGSPITSYEYSLNGGSWVVASGTTSPITISGLVNGRSYSVRLRAVNIDGKGAASNAVVGIPSTTPAAPMLGPIDAGDDVLSVPFAAPFDNGGSAITNYQYSTDNGLSWVTPYPAVTTSPMEIGGLVDHVTYQVMLRAVNANGPGTASNMQEGTPISVPPSAPTLVSPITTGDGALSVAFIAGDTGGSPITRYEYSLNGGDWVAPASVVLSSPMVITGLTNGSSYGVRLRAVNADGDGAASDELFATPSTVPGAPALATITAGDDILTVAFNTPNGDGGSPIITYQYSTDNGSSWVTPNPAVTDSPLTIGGLEDGITYKVKVRGVNANGPGAESDMKEGTPVSVPPSAPTLTSITAGNLSLSVAFTPGDDGGTPITRYEYTLNGGAWTTASGTSSPIVITSGLTNGTLYSVQLRAINADGASVGSNTLTGVPLTTPAAPTLDAVNHTDKSLSAAFTPGDDGGTPITNYQYSIDGGSSWVTASPAVTSSPLVITDLTNGTSYSVKIRAVNAVGVGPASSAVSGIPSTRASAPTLTSVTPGTASLSVAFTAGSNGGAPITNYEYSLNGGFWVAADPAVTTSPLVITGLSDGTSYGVRLRAINLNGEGVQSAQMSGTPSTVPAAPTLGTVTSGDGLLSVAFTPGGDGGSAITNYQYSTDNGDTWDTRSPADTASPLVITGLTNGTTYSVMIRAVNANGSSADSDMKTGTPQVPAPGKPALPTAVAGNGSATVTVSSGEAGGAPLGYTVTSEPGGKTCSVLGFSGSCDVTGLTNGVAYTFTVVAYNAGVSVSAIGLAGATGGDGDLGTDGGLR
ncbi:MAG: fibronectin type III domain-containing protein, partial [Actinomycetes bacterium]